MKIVPTCFVLALAAMSARPAVAEVDFERDVRPILAEKCTLCHGPDDAKGGLRLTSLEQAMLELKSGGTAIVPGDSAASVLVERIEHDDPDEVMPPPDKAEPLTEREKSVLRDWIDAGADWPRHWAYEPLSDAAPPFVPVVESNKVEAHPIDAWVRSRLEEESIQPSQQAAPRVLIRRLYYDLVGLPPEPAAVETFLGAWKQDRDRAYRDLVDELLASPRFGERWARHWLDKARYADSDGYEKDRNRPNAWRFRDWVIDAINRDLPFDEFTIQQLAGDLLPEAGDSEKLATAFHRQTLTNTEGGTDREQWRVAAVMDRTETLGAVWLGLTVSCARCHTHKYDEITQTEYYELFAYFNNGDEVNTSVRRSEEAWKKWQTDHAAHLEAVEALRKDYRQALTDLDARIPAWEAATLKQLELAAAATEPAFHPLEITEMAPPKEVVLELLDDGSYRVSGKNPPTATYTLMGTLPAGTYSGLRLDVLSDEILPKQGPGRAGGGNFVLNRLRLSLAGQQVVFGGARADFSQNGFPASAAIDGETATGKEATGWAISPQQGRDHWAEFGFTETVTLDKPTRFSLQLVQVYGSEHTLGRFRVRAMTQPTDLIVPDDVRELLRSPADQRTEEQSTRLRDYHASLAPETRRIAAAIAKLEAEAPEAPSMDVRVIAQRTKDPRQTHVLRRGEFKEPLDAVYPSTFDSLPEVEHRGPTGDRLDLARWLVSGDNPLPPRVIVNQMWSQLFGAGLVGTVEDFGVRGNRPSHPELLDWLAAEFIRLGWSRKALIRTIVLSDTYRQSSDHRPELVDIDPDNRLLARQNRFRVEAEIVRDLSLAAAGLLSDKLGGPSVFPPMPDGVADVNYNSAFKWEVSPGEDRFRRGLYTFFKRTAPHPTLMTFDCPDSNVTCVQRTRSNTPLAALITLNNEVYHEAAIGLARRVLSECRETKDAVRVDHAFEVCLSRSPSDDERTAVLDLLSQSRAHYDAHPAEADQLLEDMPAAAEATVSSTELAAWTATLRVLLNLDEFLTRG